MKEITHATTCKVPGFEAVEIVFDLMATPAQVNEFIAKMGGGGTHKPVVVEVRNWPDKEFGPDPWDNNRVPGVWMAWVSKKGWGQAMKEYLDDPNA